MIGILAVFAQLERENIKERTKMGKEARAKEGKWGGGSSEPVGYDYDPNTELLIVNDYEKMQILEAIDLALKGTPFRTIANIMNDKGYKYRGRSKMLHDWDASRLKYVFASRLYLGYISYGGVWYKGYHEPLITQDTYDQLQKLLALRDEKYSHCRALTTKISTYLGGILYCKKCGARFTKQKGRKRNPTSPEPPTYYCCYSRNKKVKMMIKDPNCKNKYWHMDELDQLVFDEIKKLAIDSSYIFELRERKDVTNARTNKIEVLKKEIENIDAQISRFMDLYGIGKFTIDQVSQKVDPLNEQRKNIEKELTQLNAEMDIMSEDDAFQIINSFSDVLERGDFDEIRLTITSLIQFIEVDDEDIYIHWKFI